MIEIDASPITIVIFVVIALAVLWASTYLAAALSQLIFLLGVFVVIAVMYGIAVRVQKRLTGERRRGDL